MWRRILLLVSLCVLAAISWNYRKVLLFSALTAVGRNQPCTVGQVVSTPGHYELGDAATAHVQQRSRLVKRESAYELWDTPAGSFWIPASNTFLAFDLGEQRRLIYGKGSEGVRRGDIVLDCGANVGVFARIALNQGAKTVVAIEPAPENLECLRRNFRDEIAAGRIVVVPKGVYDRDGFLTFQQNKNNSAADKFLPEDQGAGTIRLPITRIDALAAELQLPRIDFIKFDIEGSERFALAGAKEVMTKYHPRLAIASYHLPDDVEVIGATVRRIDARYAMRCGVCTLDANQLRLRAAILLFQ